MAEDAHPPGTVILTTYDPPKPGFPYLVVAIWPDGKVQAVSAKTVEDANTIIDGMAKELGLSPPSHK